MAFEYYEKILKSTNNAYDQLNDKQKKECLKALQDLMRFQGFYPTQNSHQPDPLPLINIIKKTCESHGYCYLPAGWVKSNQFLTIKIIKNQDST